MKKLIALAMCLIMGIFALAGCSEDGETVTKKVYDIDAEQVSGVVLDVRDRRVEAALSGDDQIHIEYFDSDKEYCDISVSENKILTMSLASGKEWTDYIGGKLPEDARKIVLRIPDDRLNSLSISTTNENISLPRLALKDEISLTANGGDISFELLDVGGSAALNAKNGDIRGSLLGGYDDFAISCDVKKGECNLPAYKEGGSRMLSVRVNNGDADIELQKD